MNSSLRVAYFTDCYHQINGVAHTSRHLLEFVRRRQLPFLCVRTGEHPSESREGPVWILEAGSSRLSFKVDRDLWFDPFRFRHYRQIQEAVREFGADVIHVTSPGDLGILGAVLAHREQIPLVASWHTNVHEFAARRLEHSLQFAPPRLRLRMAGLTEKAVLAGVLQFYRRARILLAPNTELAGMLSKETGKAVFLMERGVDTGLFHPGRRRLGESKLVFGFTGRLTPEKNVAWLIDTEEALLNAGYSNFQFLIVGEGGERERLARQMRHAVFTGVLRGEALARAYASMDVFLFPSSTDTFGNAVLEALASGVPAVVMDRGGPKYLVEDGESGLIAKDRRGFVQSVLDWRSRPERWLSMRLAARAAACRRSWDDVFTNLYATWETAGLAGPAPVHSSNAGRAGLAAGPVLENPS